MLESLRKSGSSIFIYAIFFILIAVFIINFGPQRGQSGGCSGDANSAISVDGSDLSQSAYHIAYSNPFNPGQGRQRAYVALETLIRREILANEAESRGLSASSDLMDEQIKRGNFFLGGQRIPLRGNIFDEVDGQLFWDIRRFKAWVASLNVSMNAYKEEQERSLEAQLMAQLITDPVQVSRDEALARFLYDETTVGYDVVTVRPSDYRAAIKLTDADIARFVATHDADIQAKYKADERSYKATKPAVKVREIYIAKSEPAAPAAGSGAGSAKTPAAVAGMTIDAAKAKLEAARTDITSGKLKFADAARTLSSTPVDQQNGGELGWRTVESPALGDKAVNDALKTMKPGDVSPVIATDHGAYLITVEDKREGDLSYDQVKAELAKELAKDAWSKEAARKAALVALADTQASKKPLAQLYQPEEEAPPPGPPAANTFDLEKVLNDPRLTDDDRAKLRERLKQIQMKRGGSLETPAPVTPPPAGSAAPTGPSGSGSAAGSAKPANDNDGVHGERATHTIDLPVAWNADSDGAGGPGLETTTPTTSPTTSTTTGSASVAATGSAAGSATGSAAGSAAQPAPPPEDLMRPSTETLPTFGTVPAPRLDHEDQWTRGNKMPGIVGSKGASDALFDDLAPGELAKKIYESDGNYVIVQLLTKSTPKMEDFDKQAPGVMEAMRRARQAALLEEWLKERCVALARAGKIRASADVVREVDDQGKPLPVTYRPCMSFVQ